MYLQAASESADFIHAQLDNIANVVQDGVSARQNDSCSPNNIAEPYNSGLTIEGLSILASITGQASTLQLLVFRFIFRPSLAESCKASATLSPLRYQITIGKGTTG
jgi:hypothetical protein